MSKKETAPTAGYLTHRAIVSTQDYAKKDGEFANRTDARALSLGTATYGDEYISAKVWRESDHGWSRQSEEIPIHRVLDLSILIISTLIAQKTAKLENHYLDLKYIQPELIEEMNKYLDNQKPEIDERLHEISLLLKKYGIGT